MMGCSTLKVVHHPPHAEDKSWCLASSWRLSRRWSEACRLRQAGSDGAWPEPEHDHHCGKAERNLRRRWSTDLAAEGGARPLAARRRHHWIVETGASEKVMSPARRRHRWGAEMELPARRRHRWGAETELRARRRRR